MAGTKLSGRRHFQTNNYFFKGETSFSSQVRSSLRWLLKKLLLAPTPEVNPFPPADSALGPEGGREGGGGEEGKWVGEASSSSVCRPGRGSALQQKEL